jgi:ubiquinone/menaquinone biosynthesis C-methylase UbiE
MTNQDTSHDDRLFAAFYDRVSRTNSFRHDIDPWREQLAREARGVVLEIGAGGGQNFLFYQPGITERVEAVEPNRHMLRRAESAAQEASIPIHLTQSPAEHLPFANAAFDAVLATMVFCSVDDPAQAFSEIARVLKPGGALLLFEHVRSPRKFLARMQDWLTPLQRRIAGNCHLNRDTAGTARAAGFDIEQEEWGGGGLHPMVLLVARRAGG